MVPFRQWCCDLKTNPTVPFDTLEWTELPIGEWEVVDKYSLDLYDLTEQNKVDIELHKNNFEAIYEIVQHKLADTPGTLLAAFDWVLYNKELLTYSVTVYRRRQ